MEVIIKRFFEHFETLKRDDLHTRYRRQALVTYFYNLIDIDQEMNKRQIIPDLVRAIILYHENSRKQNANACLMGKYHDILYIAVKVSYDWRLKDTVMVSALLNHIYLCEKTFERIFVGSLFGRSASYLISGWKCDFADQDENVKAVSYFCDCAANVKLEYNYGKYNRRIRFIDIPLVSCCRMSCLMLSASILDPSPDVLLMLLRYGALLVDHNSDSEETIFDMVLDMLIINMSNSAGLIKYNFHLVSCLKILLRCTDNIFLNHQSGDARKAALNKYGTLIENNILPSDRCGFEPAKLKHFSRLAVRKRLWENHQLPSGIKSLPIPANLKRYIDILED